MPSKISAFIWEEFNKAATEDTKIIKMTEEYFKEIPETEKIKFESSKKQIVQLGCGVGHYIGSLPRSVIGYDHSNSAIEYFSQKPDKVGRKIDLNAIQGDELAYKNQLINDLAIPSDILLVRILEYLDPEAVTLLLFTLISEAKPGSLFYIEIADTDDEDIQALKQIGHVHANEQGKTASYFAPRTDIRFFFHANTTKEEAGIGMKFERLVLGKL